MFPGSGGSRRELIAVNQTRYHQPQDEIDQTNLDFDSAAKFARFVFLCGYVITEDQHRPAWNKGDFFGDHYSASAI